MAREQITEEEEDELDRDADEADGKEAKAGRRRGSYSRYDKGPRLTQRDIACLLWIAQMYAIRFDQLRRLLFRLSPEAHKISAANVEAGMISKERGYKLVKKWLDLGLIEVGNPLDKERRWIWLTPYGLQVARLTVRYRRLKHTRIPHTYYVNLVRLWVEMKRPQDVWVSERELAKRFRPLKKGEHQDHLPDGELHAANGKTTVIEVELRSKDPDRLEGILRDLATHYTSIWYFLSQETRSNFEEVLARLEPEIQRYIVTYDLSRLRAELGVTSYDYDIT